MNEVGVARLKRAHCRYQQLSEGLHLLILAADRLKVAEVPAAVWHLWDLMTVPQQQRFLTEVGIRGRRPTDW